MGRLRLASAGVASPLALAVSGCSSTVSQGTAFVTTPGSTQLSLPAVASAANAWARASAEAAALLQLEMQSCAAIGGTFVNYGTIISETYMACQSTQSGDATNGKPCSEAYVGLQPNGLVNNGELGLADINYPGCFTR